MSDIAIRVQHLSKLYRIGESSGAMYSYKSLRDTLTNLFFNPFRRMINPHSSIRSQKSNDTIWALKEISFEVKRGEVIGIIGRNGAGKSTLLKILSRITEPTEGSVQINGRVGSLLEVGTGFHPELTGRENIYLNAAILGMKKQEIERKFDEIVSFSEIEKFIDTPVKHYSSGMYVRLAFAVAAHLDPEVLLVDEVLAVGDASFQKKCLGKMENVAKAGRTVLFVSHNMQAVSQLTKRCLLLMDGECGSDGPTADTIQLYNSLFVSGPMSVASYKAPPGILGNHLTWARIRTSGENGTHHWGKPIAFEFCLEIIEPRSSLCFSFQIVNHLQQPVCHFWLLDADVPYRSRPGRFHLKCEISIFRLYMGSYTLTTWLSEKRGDTLFESLSGICPFTITMGGVHRPEYEWVPGVCVYIEDAKWEPVKEETVDITEI